MKKSINIAAGVIDPDFHGELKVILVNNGQGPVTIHQGDCIAQLILENTTLQDVLVKDELTDTMRGESRFGSTEMTDDLAKVYTITLGHAAKKHIWPQEEQYQELCNKMKDIVQYYADNVDVFDSKLSMSKCATP